MIDGPFKKYQTWLFTNDELAECSPYARLLLPGYGRLLTEKGEVKIALKNKSACSSF